MPHRQHLLAMLSALVFFSLLAVAWYGAIVLQPDRPPSMPSTPSTPSPDCGKDVAPVPSRTVYQVLDLDALSTSLSTEHPDSARLTRRVLILTPLMDAVHYLDNYFDKLTRLDYPQQLISLGFLVSTTTASPRQDPTLVAMQSHISILRAQSSYRKITLLHQASQSTGYTHSERHAYEVQEKRRKALAKCRNQLLISALMDESWVLWLDADVVEYSPRLMTELMALNKDIVVPNCFRSETSWFADKIIPYDRNNWFETTESKANQRVLDKDEIQFEGYSQDHPTFRQSMADLASSAPQLVELDGVGGTFTLVKAAVHRAGVSFPTSPIDHEIETEGLAKWAKLLGFSVCGAPHLAVWHA